VKNNLIHEIINYINNLNPNHPLLPSIQAFLDRYSTQFAQDGGAGMLENIPRGTMNEIIQALNSRDVLYFLSNMPYGIIFGAAFAILIGTSIYFRNEIIPILGNSPQEIQESMRPLLLTHRYLSNMLREHNNALQQIIERNNIIDISNPLMFHEEGRRSINELIFYAHSHESRISALSSEIENINNTLIESYNSVPVPEEILVITNELQSIQNNLDQAVVHIQQFLH
jgi:hypothetical protein